MSFGKGDLYINSAINFNNEVANVTLFKVSSLTGLKTQSLSCITDGRKSTAKASVVKAITGEISTGDLSAESSVTCNSGSDTSEWTFSQCSSYLPSITASSVGSNSTLSIGPCASQCGVANTAAADGITVLVIDFVEKVPAPSVQSITFKSFRSEIVAEVVLSASGSAYCAAFPSSFVPPSVDLIMMTGNLSTTSSSLNSARVVMSNLQASSSFAVYCSTTKDGLKMSYAAMLNTKAMVRTLCCKSVIAQLLVTSVAQDVSEQSALRLSVDSPPSTDITVYLNMTLASSPDGSVSPFFPKKVVFLAGVVRSTVVSFRAATLGKYFLDFALTTNQASKEFEITYPNGQSNFLNVVEVNKEMPPPQFLSSEFTSSGASIILKFTAPTNKALLPSSFACPLLLNFTGSAEAQCQWVDTATAVIYPAGSTAIVVGDYISIAHGSNLRAMCSLKNVSACEKWEKLSESTTPVPVRPPSNAQRPVVRISSPSTIGSCDAYTLDFLASTGSGGRDWTNSSFSVTCSNSSYSKVAQEFLRKNWQLTRPITIPKGVLVKSQSYNFVIILCNFLGSCGQSSRAVTVLNTVYPTVSILGMQTRTINRNASLSLSSQAFTALCDGSLSQQDLVYSWSVSSSGQVEPTLKSESKDLSKFSLSPYRLLSNTFYTITLAVLNTRFLKSATASVQVYVQRGDVVAVINEGSGISVVERERKKWTLQATDSFDTDTLASSRSASSLTYQWTCLQIRP